jgi:hypothetical protein
MHFTLIVCAAGFGTAYVAAKIMGYDAAVAAGLLAGAYTNLGDALRRDVEQRAITARRAGRRAPAPSSTGPARRRPPH